jgi:hypothetical protein
MKKIVFFAFSILLVISSCKKKPTSTGCYVCKWYKVVYSSYEVLAKPLYLYATDTICHENDGFINQYMQTHSYYDTLTNGHDTLTFVENSMQCNGQ